MTELSRKQFRALHRMCEYKVGGSYYFDWCTVTMVTTKHYTLDVPDVAKPNNETKRFDLKLRESTSDQVLLVLREMYENWVIKERRTKGLK